MIISKQNRFAPDFFGGGGGPVHPPPVPSGFTDLLVATIYNKNLKS